MITICRTLLSAVVKRGGTGRVLRKLVTRKKSKISPVRLERKRGGENLKRGKRGGTGSALLLPKEVKKEWS